MNVILDIIVIDAMNFVAHSNGLAIVVLTAVNTRMAVIDRKHKAVDRERMAVGICTKIEINRSKFAAIKRPRPGTKYRQARTRSNKG